MAWFLPAFWPWNGFSVLVVSYYRIVTAIESRAAPRSLEPSSEGPGQERRERTKFGRKAGVV